MIQFMCWNNDDNQEDEASPIMAIDAEGAAEMFAENRDDSSGEWSDSQTVYVRDDKGMLYIFTVEAEPDVIYHAEKIADVPSDD